MDNDLLLKAIQAGRGAIADECIALQEALDRNSIISRIHRKRILEKIEKHKKYIKEIDAFLGGDR